VGNKKSLFLVITSLTFLISGAICAQLSVLPVFAAPPHPCFEGAGPSRKNRACDNNTAAGTARCCWTEQGLLTCQTCQVNTDTGEFENCTDPYGKRLPDSSIIAPPPSGVAPPPPPGPGQGGPGNVLPEGVFEGPTTPPRQQKMTPEIAPLPPTCPPGQVLDEDTNLCFRVSQEQEEQQQQSEVTEEEQPVPVCQEGLEFNEDLGFCVPTECPEGQVLDDDSGLCVLEEPEAAEEQPEQSETEQPEQQSSEGGDGDRSEDNSNNDDN
jgi:hypothetical protein